MKQIFIMILLLCYQSIIAQNKKEISIEDMWQNYIFVEKSVDGFYSMKDGIHYTELTSDEQGMYIIKYSFSTGIAVDTIYNSNEITIEALKKISAYTFNADESKIIFPINTKQIYRHSTLSFHYLYDINSKTALAIDESKAQMNPALSPDGTHIAYVSENNVYIKNINTLATTAITSDGKTNAIINGATDWVYEEEFGLVQGLAWNSDGTKLAYMKFDESEVPVYTLQYFFDLYPKNYTYKYPKVGEKNAAVSIHIYDMNKKSTIQAQTQTTEESYLPRFQWMNDANSLCITRMNRLQNKLEILKINANTGSGIIFFTERSDTYIEVQEQITIIDKDKSFIWMSEIDGYNHLYHYDSNGKLINQITKGAYDITSFYGYDPISKTLYYQSAETSPLMRQIYKIQLDGSNKKQLINFPGTNEASFSSNFSYFLNSHSSFTKVPTFEIYDHNGKLVRILEENKALGTTLTGYTINYPESFTFISTQNIELNGYIIKPHGFDPNKKYPVYMTQYSGPGSQEAIDQWNGMDLIWHNHLASKGYMIVCVDGRGTGARGANFKKVTYKNLGKYETIDQIEVVKYLRTKHYIDTSRIGIFGWSFGGYMVARCMGIGADYFKLGIAVAPVVDWRYYDSIYTERYMQTDKENKSGYDSTSVLPYVKNIRGKLLLIHGLADDNVHYQNTAMLLSELYKRNIRFDQMTFPNRNHGIYGGNTRFYLFSRLSEYIVTNL